MNYSALCGYSPLTASRSSIYFTRDTRVKRLTEGEMRGRRRERKWQRDTELNSIRGTRPHGDRNKRKTAQRRKKNSFQ